MRRMKSLNNALAGFGQKLQQKRHEVDDAFKNVLDTVSKTLDSVAQSIADKITAQLESTLADAKAEVAGLAGDSLNSATSNLTAEMVKNVLDPLVDDIAEKAPAGALRNLLKTTLDPVKNLIGGAMDDLIKDTVTGAVDRITGSVSDAINAGNKSAADKIKAEIHKVLDPQIDRIKRRLTDLKVQIDGCKTAFVRGQAPQNSKLAEPSVGSTQDVAPPFLSFAVPDPCLWNCCFAPQIDSKLDPLFKQLQAIANIQIGNLFSTLEKVEVDVTAIGISHAKAFVGLPPKDGKIDWTHANANGLNKQGAIGLFVNGLDMGLG